MNLACLWLLSAVLFLAPEQSEGSELCKYHNFSTACVSGGGYFLHTFWHPLFGILIYMVYFYQMVFSRFMIVGISSKSFCTVVDSRHWLPSIKLCSDLKKHNSIHFLIISYIYFSFYITNKCFDRSIFKLFI